ncbi:hypothetical protein AB0I84_23560 [Streptomyces spectabilis]|uniref:hypothetical protein n=1 Tax=Streptomyces spectabilis TaxID=68270 RepID=UPI0034032D71
MTDESTFRSTTVLQAPPRMGRGYRDRHRGVRGSLTDFRGSFRADTQQRIDALDAYFRACRRPPSEGPCRGKFTRYGLKTYVSGVSRPPV